MWKIWNHKLLVLRRIQFKQIFWLFYFLDCRDLSKADIISFLNDTPCMKKWVIIDTSCKDSQEETPYTNWNLWYSFSSYEIRFIAALEQNFRYVNRKTRLLVQGNSTIYAPVNFFQGGSWRNCFPFYSRTLHNIRLI